jgi:hypothetical protein
MNRRDFLTGAGALALSSYISNEALSAPESCVLTPPIIDKPVKPERAASLQRLLAEAKTGKTPRLGMTRIDGYVEEDNDVILWGRFEPREEELRFDDLIVAVRSVKGKYYDYSDVTPGVSLDWKTDPSAKSRRESDQIARSRSTTYPYPTMRLTGNSARSWRCTPESLRCRMIRRRPRRSSMLTMP